MTEQDMLATLVKHEISYKTSSTNSYIYEIPTKYESAYRERLKTKGLQESLAIARYDARKFVEIDEFGCRAEFWRDGDVVDDSKIVVLGPFELGYCLIAELLAIKL